MLKKLSLALLGLLVLAAVYMLSLTYTEPKNLWSATGSFAGCVQGSSCVSSVSEHEVHAIAPIGFSSGLDPRDAIEQAVISLPGARLQTSRAEYLHVVFVSSLGLRDDVELLVHPTAYIDVRSVSRLGFGGQDSHRARIEALRAAFDARRGGN